MNKIAAYDTVLRRHPLWEEDYQEKEAGIAAVRAIGNTVKGGATSAFNATGIPTAARGLADAAKGGAAGLRSQGPLTTRINRAVAGAYPGVARASTTPLAAFVKGNLSPT